MDKFPLAAVTRSAGKWSNTYNIDNPAVSNRDDESIARIQAENPGLCEGKDPVGVYSKTADGRPWHVANQTVRQPCTVEYGFLCISSENEGGCEDYQVELLCPHQDTTQAPVVAFNTCTGVTCSGHGMCRSDSEGSAMCFCDPGWFQRDCSEVPLNLTIASDVSECGGPPLLTSPGGR